MHDLSSESLLYKCMKVVPFFFFFVCEIKILYCHKRSFCQNLLTKLYLLTFPQMLEDMRALLQTMDEKRLSSIAELSAKHQKVECILGAVYIFKI